MVHRTGHEHGLAFDGAGHAGRPVGEALRRVVRADDQAGAEQQRTVAEPAVTACSHSAFNGP